MVLIPNDIGVRMRLEAEAQLLQPTRPVGEIPADLPELRQGQAFTARILEALPENTFRALVAGKSLTLSLPEGAKAGDTLDLVVVDRSPKVIVARLAPQPAAVDGEPTPYPYANVSRTGQLVSSLLPAEGEPPAAATLNRGQPLLAQAPLANGTGASPPSTAALASALGAAVRTSGLFYESHQAQWVTGQFPLAQLLEEPQAQHSDFTVLVSRLLAEPTTGGAAANAGGSPAAGSGAIGNALATLLGAGATGTATPAAATTLPHLVEGQLPPLPVTAGASGTAEAAVRGSGADPAAATGDGHALANVWRAPAARDAAILERLAQWPAPGDAGTSARPAAQATAIADRIPDDVRPLVQQQLDAAGSERLIWHGEAWPRQAMHWTIERDGKGNPGDADERRWITSLTLTTPTLGEVAARLQVGSDGVRIAVLASESATGPMLRDAIPALAESLAAAGVPLRGIVVRDKPVVATNDAP